MSDEEPLGSVAALRIQNALLRQQVAHLEEERAADKARIAALERRIAEAEREALKTKTPPPPWAKASRPTREKPAGQPRKKPAGQPRKKRDATHNHGRRTMTPTRSVQHAFERCPDGDYALRGASIARRREVIELPEAPIEVTEHQILTR